MNNPFSHLEGMHAMSDTLGFIKKLWGGLNVPGMVAPPMSLDELDKKIQYLKTVESWLTVNMNMLRATIQALEVQRATISTLQSLGESFAQHARQAGGTAEQMASSFAQSPAHGWPMPEAASAGDEGNKTNSEEVHAEKSANTAASSATPETEAPSAAAFTNPAAWWGMLQEQFKAAVDKSLQATSQAGEAAMKAAASVTPARADSAAANPGSKAKAAATKPESAAKSPKKRGVKTAAAQAKPAVAAKASARKRSAAVTQKKTTKPA